MRIAAAVIASLLVLAGCQSGDDEADPTPVETVPGETPSPTPTPTEEPTDEPTEDSLTFEDVEGSWTSDDGSEMTFNLNADGTYTLDVAEAEEISSGTYEVEGNTVTFIEGEADRLSGTVEDDRLITPTATYVKQ